MRRVKKKDQITSVSSVEFNEALRTHRPKFDSNTHHTGVLNEALKSLTAMHHETIVTCIVLSFWFFFSHAYIFPVYIIYVSLRLFITNYKYI